MNLDSETDRLTQSPKRSASQAVEVMPPRCRRTMKMREAIVAVLLVFAFAAWAVFMDARDVDGAGPAGDPCMARR